MPQYWLLIMRYYQVFSNVHEQAGFSLNKCSSFTSRNMRMAPTAEPICVTIPHQSNAFLPFSLSVVAMLTLENVMNADSKI